MTSTHDWDDYWAGITVPKEMKTGRSRVTDAILEVLRGAIPAGNHPRVLEVGGAPGAYLAYFARQDCNIALVDNSPRGCELARSNFSILGLPCDVVEADLFSATDLSGEFDMVYSLGLIEHFEDDVSLVDAHAAFLRPGGILVLGCPNLAGPFERPLKWLRPKMMRGNDRRVMNFKAWDRFERELGLERLYRGYVGGFSLGAFGTTERPAVLVRALVRLAKPRLTALDLSAFGFLNRFNGRWSYYMMGVYQIRP